MSAHGTHEVADLVRSTEGEGAVDVEEGVKDKRFERRESFHLDLSMERKGIVKGILDGAFTAPEKRVVTLAERIARWTVRPATGVPLLLIVLYFGLYKFVGEFGAGTTPDVDQADTRGMLLHAGLWASFMPAGIGSWRSKRSLPLHRASSALLAVSVLA